MCFLIFFLLTCFCVTIEVSLSILDKHFLLCLIRTQGTQLHALSATERILSKHLYPISCAMYNEDYRCVLPLNVNGLQSVQKIGIFKLANALRTTSHLSIHENKTASSPVQQEMWDPLHWCSCSCVFACVPMTLKLEVAGSQVPVQVPD